jgi:nitroreductase
VDVQEPEGQSGPQLHATEDIIRYVVANAVWAPSVHNTQPWRFSAEGHEISLHADQTRQLTVSDPDGREMLISCGAALFTARLALRSLGYIPETVVLPEPAQPALAARLSWHERAPATDYEQRLMRQIRRRRTHRGGFDSLPLSSDMLTALRGSAARDKATLRVMAEDGRRVLGASVQAAEQALRLDSARVQELARWAPPPGSGRPDGVPPTSYPARQEHTSPDYPGRDFAHGRGWGLPLFSPAPWPRSAGTVAILTTADDQPADWISAGHALQRILLMASTCGIAAALHSQPLELPQLRADISAQLCSGAFPQLVLRLGTITQIAASVRRAPEDVMF